LIVYVLWLLVLIAHSFPNTLKLPRSSKPKAYDFILTGVVGSYSIYKLKSLNNPISEGDGEELGRVNPSNVQESQVRLESTYRGCIGL
jgi:hypothetical protein